jgi:hypothetical protein
MMITQTGPSLGYGHDGADDVSGARDGGEMVAQENCFRRNIVHAVIHGGAGVFLRSTPIHRESFCVEEVARIKAAAANMTITGIHDNL